MTSFFVRVDLDSLEQLEKFDEFLEDQFSPTMYKYCRHKWESDGDRHIHFYMETADASTKYQFDKRFKKFGLKGNKEWSSKISDPWGVPIGSYLLHDYVDKCLDQKEKPTVEGAREQMYGIYDPNDDDKFYQDCIDLAEEWYYKKRKNNKRYVFEDIFKYVQTMNVGKNDKEIARAVLQYHLDNDLMIRKNVLITYIETIALRLNKDDSDYKRNYLAQILRWN